MICAFIGNLQKDGGRQFAWCGSYGALLCFVRRSGGCTSMEGRCLAVWGRPGRLRTRLAACGRWALPGVSCPAVPTKFEVGRRSRDDVGRCWVAAFRCLVRSHVDGDRQGRLAWLALRNPVADVALVSHAERGNRVARSFDIRLGDSKTALCCDDRFGAS